MWAHFALFTLGDDATAVFAVFVLQASRGGFWVVSSEVDSLGSWLCSFCVALHLMDVAE